MNTDLKQKIEKCKDVEGIDNIILEEYKSNKDHLKNKNSFEKDLEILYNSKNLKIKKYHLTYLFNKFTKICFNLSYEVFQIIAIIMMN